MRTFSDEAKLLLAAVALSLAAGALGAELVLRHFEGEVESLGTHLLQGAAEGFALQQRAEAEKLSSTLDALMASAELRQAFEAGDRGRLLRLAAPLLETLRARSHVTHWYFHTAGPSPKVFLRVHRPDLHGDRVQRATMRRAVESGDVGAGLELGRTAFALRVVRPWVAGGKIIGYMELAEEIDHFLTAMKGRTGDEYGLLVRKKYLDPAGWAAAVRPSAASWDATDDALVVDATSSADGILGWRGDVERLPSGGLALGETEARDRVFIRGVFPVADATGRRVGALFVLHDFTAHHQAARQGRGYTLAVIMLAALVAGGGVALLFHLLVFRRLARLRARLERRAEGLAPAGRPGPLASADDLGRLESLYERVLREHGEPTGETDLRPPGGAAPPAAPDVPPSGGG